MSDSFIPSALELSPVDVNYLSARLRYDQFTQNGETLTLSGDVSALETPIVQTMGDGIVQLSGSLTVTEAVPTANMLIATLPNKYTISQDKFFPVLVKRGSSLVFNGIFVDSSIGSINSVIIKSPGTYPYTFPSAPTISTTGPGSGAIFSSNLSIKTVSVITSQSGLGSYVPGDSITLTGGTFSAAAVLNVTNTKVVSATVMNAGNGGTDGTQTVTGTTGTGTKFTASVTIASGAISAINSITLGGNYTVNPLALTNEPITGAGLVGASLSVVMGVKEVSMFSGGVYSGTLPTNPLSQGSTSGAGTGATFDIGDFYLNSIDVLAGGSGYNETSALTISEVGSPGATTQIVLAKGNPSLRLMEAATQNDIVYLDGINFLVNSYS